MMRSLLNIFITLVLAAGCASDNKQPSATEATNSTVQAEDPATNDGSSQTISNQPDDSRRPIEDSEGIPGYLHDPSKLAVVPNADQTQLTISTNATDDKQIKPRPQLKLSSYSVRMVDLLAAIENNEAVVDATLLDSIAVTDASFSLDFPDPYPNVVVITTAPDQGNGTLALASDIEQDVTFSQSLDDNGESFIELDQTTAVDIKKRFIKQADVNNDQCFDSSDIVQLFQECPLNETPPREKRYCDLNGDGVFSQADYDTPENLVVYEVCINEL